MSVCKIQIDIERAECENYAKGKNGEGKFLKVEVTEGVGLTNC